MANQFEAIITLVNRGFSDLVMEAARSEGARGGTVINARGTADKNLSKKYGVAITPDKELVLIVVNTAIRDKVLEAIYKAAGLETDGHGIAFAIPVDSVAGLKYDEPLNSEEKVNG
ncbi:MAG: P-II family nitrogen regulator [Bacilli bacterium]|nr:P-II family nitrogen regulator [Bacilli bacterium]